MDSFNPTLNIAGLARKQKGLVKLFGGMASPFYFTNDVVAEGQPMKLSTTQDEMEKVADGDGADCIGLAMQMTYDDSAFGQLAGYHFANDTRQRIGGAIGLLTGSGYALTTCYSGTVAWGDGAYIDGQTLKMTATASTGNGLPVVFEGAGTDGATLVRIRFNFPLATASADPVS